MTKTTRLLDPETPTTTEAEEPQTAVSPVRFYCLFVVTMLAGLQGAWWNNFGPISAAVNPFYGWDDATIALLSNWGPIGYFVAVVPTAWLLDVAGIRASCIVGMTLVFGGSVLRCVHVAADPTSAALMQAGQILNGLAGPIAMSISPVLSAAWFAPHERTAATAIASGANYGFAALTFVAGPMLVPPPTTNHSLPNSSYKTATMADDPSADTQVGLRRYMAAQAVVSGVVLLMALVMPSRPTYAPSRSATTSRAPMWSGLRLLLHHPAFWCLALCYGMLTGFFGAWGSMLGPNMMNVLPPNVAEREAGWLGCYGALAGMAGGFVLGVTSDRLEGGRKKKLLLTCCAISACGFLFFACFCARLIAVAPSRLLLALYVSSITGTLFCNSTIPLFYEMAVEAVYPIAEGLSTAVLTTLNNIGCLLFLLVQNVPHIGTAWMNWAVAGTAAAALLAIVPLGETRRRYAIDMADDVAAADVEPRAGCQPSAASDSGRVNTLVVPNPAYVQAEANRSPWGPTDE